MERAAWASGALIMCDWMTPDVWAGQVTVQKGDTLSKIARIKNVSVEALQRANGIKGTTIHIGQVLTLPEEKGSPTPRSKETRYQVTKGDTVAAISRKTGASINEIRDANRLKNDLIYPGQVLVIPATGKSSPKENNELKESKKKYYVGPVQRKIDLRNLKERRWRHIIMHHSGTPSGSGKIFDYYHREIKRMENGLAYHFVIGNGSDSGDGQIEVAERWRRQIQGGHVRSDAYNDVSIGICLVGNFERQKPSRKQVASAIELVDHLKNGLLDGRPDLLLHREIQKTICPGKHFPAKGMQRIFS
ncbi:MAG: LysM peptidoglycan-binding domain-containing protein [Verrucomicrobiota bacterium]